MNRKRWAGLWRKQPLRVGVPVAGSIAVQGLAISNPDRATPEMVLLQAVASVLAFWGAFELGQSSARAAATEMLGLQAGSRFRRVLALYGALGRFLQTIETRRALVESESTNGKTPTRLVLDTLAIIEVQIAEQLDTADHAMEDWRDLVPDEVAAIEARSRELKHE